MRLVEPGGEQGSPRPRAQSLVVAFDLEMNQPSNRIVQIGAVAGDLRTGAVVDRFVQLVDPGERLARSIAQLTGIEAAALAQAPALPEAFERFAAWLAPLGRERKLHPLVWGVWDVPQLKAQLGAPGDATPKNWPFGQRWLDVKAVYQAWRHAQGGTGLAPLERAAQHLGIDFEGRAHDALVDATNTFRVYVALLERLRR